MCFGWEVNGREEALLWCCEQMTKVIAEQRAFFKLQALILQNFHLIELASARFEEVGKKFLL